MLLFPLLLDLLRARIPNLLDHPALLAHTIYQTIVFDDAVRDGGFNVDAVSINEGLPSTQWEGLAGVILREHDWYDQWLAGEKKCRCHTRQLTLIIHSRRCSAQRDHIVVRGLGYHRRGLGGRGRRYRGRTEIVDQLAPDQSPRRADHRYAFFHRTTIAESCSDRYSPLPALEYKLPFLTTIQLPLLDNYLSRISGSLDAFESLSSAFARVVPGALSGNTRSGVHIDQTKLTGGTAGLARLMKALISAEWITSALRVWADDVVCPPSKSIVLG